MVPSMQKLSKCATTQQQLAQLRKNPLGSTTAWKIQRLETELKEMRTKIQMDRQTLKLQQLLLRQVDHRLAA